MAQPDILKTAFGENAAPETISDIPEVRAPSDPPQKATWSAGFPKVTMTPVAAGGIPPMGQDFNGILKALSEHIVYQNKGGVYKWSSDAAPYAKGSIIQSDDERSAYVSLVDGNNHNPNTTPDQIGVSWAAYSGTALTENYSPFLQENVKVTVGAGGDFPTINAAVLYLSRFTPDLGVTAEVELMSGFVMEEQLFVEGLDLGWITITGVDAETVINEPSLTRALAEAHKPAFGVTNGTLPTIGQLFSFSSKGDPADLRSGMVAYSVGRATILEGCGVKNAGNHGFLADNGSTINADGANASGAGVYGILSDNGSTINAKRADASGAGFNGIHAFGSIINASEIDVSGAGSYGIYANAGSTINADGANASGAGVYGISSGSGSTINANRATGTLDQAKNTVTSHGIIFQV